MDRKTYQNKVLSISCTTNHHKTHFTRFVASFFILFSSSISSPHFFFQKKNMLGSSCANRLPPQKRLQNQTCFLVLFVFFRFRSPVFPFFIFRIFCSFFSICSPFFLIFNSKFRTVYWVFFFHFVSFFSSDSFLCVFLHLPFFISFKIVLHMFPSFPSFYVLFFFFPFIFSSSIFTAALHAKHLLQTQATVHPLGRKKPGPGHALDDLAQSRFEEQPLQVLGVRRETSSHVCTQTLVRPLFQPPVTYFGCSKGCFVRVRKWFLLTSFWNRTDFARSNSTPIKPFERFHF